MEKVFVAQLARARAARRCDGGTDSVGVAT